MRGSCIESGAKAPANLPPGQGGAPIRRMRLVLATKRENDMTKRDLLFLMNAAKAGDGAAACRLGDMHREGSGGLRYSPKQAFHWYARSALAGDANGQNNLGACYQHGIGCAQSYAKAAGWYRRSAAQHLGTASMNLGYCYLRGKGIPADRTEALRLFRLAVKQGEPKAGEELERLDELVEEPGAETRVRFRDVTEQGVNIGLIGGQACQSLPEAALPPVVQKIHVPDDMSPDFEGITDPAVKAAMKDDCFELPPVGSAAYKHLLDTGNRALEVMRLRRAKQDQQLAAASTHAGSAETPRADEGASTDDPSAKRPPAQEADPAR